jgi:transcription initiation factor TFIID subunit 9B
MILANLGVNAYQERVPLQLMDLAYRYTSSVLQDALHLTAEAYGVTANNTGKGAAANTDLTAITPLSLRLSIASRTQYQFNPSLPKEHFLDLAQEKNRVALPPVGKGNGVRLPPERYCLTGVGWGLREEWDSEGDVEVEVEADTGDHTMGGDADDNGEEEGDDKMEDVFGSDFEGEGEDKNMDDE